jgi:hypothetical protein
VANVDSPAARVSGQSHSSGDGGSVWNTARSATIGTGLQQSQSVPSTVSTYNIGYFQQWLQMIEGAFNIAHFGLGPFEPSPKVSNFLRGYPFVTHGRHLQCHCNCANQLLFTKIKK